MKAQNRAPGSNPLFGALFALPLLLVVAKVSGAPGSELVAKAISATDLSPHLRQVAENILLIPLGAVVVVAVRLTLGLRVLGLFRPILLAMAFGAIGVPLGLAFLIPVLAFVVVLRPLLRTDHSYARVAVLLSLVASFLMLPLIVGHSWDIGWLQRLAGFPIIALCLTCESFAKVANAEGSREAVWRAFTTVAAAIVIMAIAHVRGAVDLFLRFPELLLAQAGCVLLINKYLSLRLLDGFNPLPLRLPPVEPPSSSPLAADSSPQSHAALAPTRRSS
jgi:uncharacterized protein with transglutaminase domain